jgi:hypothetical protein
MAVYIALYFYDGCCNIAKSLDDQKETASRNGTLLLLANIGLIILYLFLKSSGIKSKGSNQ